MEHLIQFLLEKYPRAFLRHAQNWHVTGGIYARRFEFPNHGDPESQRKTNIAFLGVSAPPW